MTETTEKDELSPEELEEQVGEELPDREAMSVVSCDPSEFIPPDAVA